MARRQATALGVGDGALRAAVRARRLLPYRRGVFAWVGAPAQPVQPVLAAVLAAGPDAVASHWAAAALHGLKGVAPGAPEITIVGRNGRELRDVMVHGTAEPLHDADRTSTNRVPVTSVARTFIDLAGTGRLWLVERALDDALVRGLCRLPDLVDAMGRATHHRGLVGMRRLLDARTDERVDSQLERRWLREIRGAGLAPPVLHHRVLIAGVLYEIDVAWPRERVGFDVNGWVAHGTRSAFDHDARRGLLLLSAGWRIATLTSATPPHLVVSAARVLLRSPDA